MNIITISIAPIFKDYVHGGSQMVLCNVFRYLGLNGHKIRLFCTSRPDNEEPFELYPNVEVFPILKFRKTFPMPYETSPYHLVNIIRKISEETQWGDLLYIHADGFYFKNFFHGKIPIVTSLHDFVYPISMVSAFNLWSDNIIVPSYYLKQCILDCVGPFYTSFEDKVVTIPNGIDLSFFKPVSPSRIYDWIPVNEKDQIVLFPHRPEEKKGISYALRLLHMLKKKYNFSDLKILIPRYIDLRVSSDLTPYYQQVMKTAKKYDLTRNIIFYDWLPTDLMPELYSLGDLTLCIGNFVESFGLIPLESLACKTPVIASRVGAYRTNIPENIGIPMVDFGDFDNIEKYAIKILKGNSEIDYVKIEEYIETMFPYNKMLQQYEEIFKNTHIKFPPKLRLPEETGKIFSLAPWCYLTEKGIYNDYRGYIKKDPLYYFLHKLKMDRRDNFILEQAIEYGLSRKIILEKVREGILVPVQSEGGLS